jgi:hypothetical protein
VRCGINQTDGYKHRSWQAAQGSRTAIRVYQLQEPIAGLDREALEGLILRGNEAVMKASSDYEPTALSPYWAVGAGAAAIIVGIGILYSFWFRIVPYFLRRRASRLMRKLNDNANQVRADFPDEIATFGYGLDLTNGDTLRHLIKMISAHLEFSKSIRS